MYRRGSKRHSSKRRGNTRYGRYKPHQSTKKSPYYELKGRRWYYYYLSQKDKSGKINKSPNNRPKIGLLDEYDENAIKEGVLVQFTPPHLHLFSYFHTIIDFMQYEANFKLEDRGFFETVLGQCKQKPHFDLDVNLIEHATVLAEVKDKNTDQIMDDMITYLVCSIQQAFNEMNLVLNLERDILLFSSHGEKKRSYHLVVNNYCHRTCDEADRFYKVIVRKMPPLFHRWVDHSVYKSIQQFRMEGSQKVGSGRIKQIMTKWSYGGKIVKTDLNTHWQMINQLNENQKKIIWANEAKLRYSILNAALLMNTSYCKVLPDFIVLLPAEEIKLPSEYSNGVDDNRALAAVELLAESMGLSLYSQNFPFQFKKVVAGGLIVLKRNQASYCKACERIHDNENPFMYIIGGNVYFDCRRHPENKRTKVGYVPGDDEEIKDDTPSPDELDKMNFTIPTVNSFGKVLSNTSSSSNISSSSNTSSSSKSDELYSKLDDLACGITYTDGKKTIKKHRFIQRTEFSYN